LVEMKESRNFDVFFGVFLVFGRERKRREKLGQRENFRGKKKVSSLFGACLGLFIALGAKIEATAIVRPPASNPL